jgi:hypothetical protein
MSENLVSAELSAEDRQAVLDAIALVREKLPFLIALSPEDRKALPKMGDKGRGFVVKSLEIAKQNPDILVRSFDVDEFAKDLALADALSPVLLAVQSLHEMIDDTLLAVGSDAYLAALEVYGAAKRAKAPGFDELAASMGRRFKRTRSTPSTPAA